MSITNLLDESDEEREIATMAARVLSERFIEAAQNGTVMYVENDNVMRKDPNGVPVIIKRLSGRNPELEKRVADRSRTFKIRKHRVNLD